MVQGQPLVDWGPPATGGSIDAALVPERLGAVTAALSQDYLRRTLVADDHLPKSVTPRLVVDLAKEPSAQGFDVIVEGMLRPSMHGSSLQELQGSDGIAVDVIRLVIDFLTALARHRGQKWSERILDGETPSNAEIPAESWCYEYVDSGLPCEFLIDARHPLDEIVDRIVTKLGSSRERVPSGVRRVNQEPVMT